MRDLRVSVTDRCNFRCGYCMPKSAFGPGHRFLPGDALLTFDEIARVVEAAVALGVRKVRLTGGEPLLRPGLDQLVARLSRLPVRPELALTTNGALLADQTDRLREAGLDRITVSLDSLDPQRFGWLSGVDAPLAEVLAGIDAAAAAGFPGLRVNTVVRRDHNEEDVVEIARRFRGTKVVARFIEYMDVGGTVGWSRREVVPAHEILDRLSSLGELIPLPPLVEGTVARRYGWADGSGEIGVIASVTQPFCRDCVRLRLSADGTLYTCLFASQGFPLVSTLRAGTSVPALSALLESVWAVRQDRYSELRDRSSGSIVQLGPKVSMSTVGG